MVNWQQLCEPLVRRGLLVHCESGQHFWFEDGGATARRGGLWFVLGRNPVQNVIDCDVTVDGVSGDISSDPSDYAPIESLLVSKGVSERTALRMARDLGDAYAQVEAIAALIEDHLIGAEDDVALCKENIEMYKGLAPHVERMFRAK
jgi:hypothetical protein